MVRTERKCEKGPALCLFNVIFRASEPHQLSIALGDHVKIDVQCPKCSAPASVADARHQYFGRALGQRQSAKVNIQVGNRTVANLNTMIDGLRITYSINHCCNICILIFNFILKLWCVATQANLKKRKERKKTTISAL